MQTDPEARPDAASRGWRWSNVPVPEPHVGLLVVALIAEQWRPWPLRPPGARGEGWTLILAGAGLAGWATAAAGEVDLSHPDRVVTEGPYRLLHHPMYVGWTAVYVGVGLARRTAWPLALSPALAAWMFVTTQREARALAHSFGPAAESQVQP